MTDDIMETMMLSQLLSQNSADDAYDDDDEDSFDAEYFDEDFDDDDDEESFDFYGDSYAEFDDDDDDDEGFGESFAEKRKARRIKVRPFRRRKVRRRKGAKTALIRNSNGQTIPVKFSKSFATTKTLQASEAKLQAIMKSNHNKLARSTKSIASQTRKLEKRIAKMESAAKMAQLMPLLVGQPKLTEVKVASTSQFGANKTIQVESSETEKPDMMLPLLLSGMGGGSGSNNSMMLALALM